MRIRKLYRKWNYEPVFLKVNAAYELLTNTIWVPMGILTPPFFSTGSLVAANYGSLGSIIGHELTHGFDNRGAKFDQNGRKKVAHNKLRSARRQSRD